MINDTKPQNLKLPLCPKCGDTKFVSDEGHPADLRIQTFAYYCSICNISWNEHFISDHNLQKTWRFIQGMPIEH